MATNGLDKVFFHLRRAVLLQDGGGQTDGKLLGNFIENRDETSFEVLMRRHGPMVLNVCRRILHNQQDAQDAVQTTFLVLVRKANSVKPRELVGNWLHAVARQTAIRMRSKNAKRWWREKQVTTMPEPQSVNSASNDDLLILDQELSRLPEKYRIAIVLCDLEGKTQKQAARQLGWPEGTLGTRLARGRTMLAKRIAKHGLLLSVEALAVALTQNLASASLPPALVSTTVKAASMMAAGKTVAAGLISAKVFALTQGMVKGMLLTKLKTTLAVMVVVGVSTFGGGLFVQRILGTLAADEVKEGTTQTKGAKSASNLVAQEPKVRATLKGHSGSVASVAFSPDGKTLASASLDKTIKLWDIATSKENATFKGHTDNVLTVKYSPDGKTLASASFDGTIKLWDMATGNEQTSLMDGKRVLSVAFSPDGKTLASVSDSTIKMWDVAASTEQATLKGHTNLVWSVSYSPNGKMLASASHDKTIKLWDSASGTEQVTLKGHLDSVKSVAYSPDGKTLASASDDKTIKLWDLATGGEKASLKAQFGFMFSMAFSPDNKTLASTSQEKTIELWDVATGKKQAILKGPNGSVYSPVFSPDGKTLATASDGNAIILWDIPLVQEIKKENKGAKQEIQNEPPKEFTNGTGGEQDKMQVDGSKEKQAEGQKTEKQPRTEKRSGELELQAVDLVNQTIKVIEGKIKLGWNSTGSQTNGPSNGLTMKLGAVKLLWAYELDISVGPTTKITIDGKIAQLADLQTDHLIWVKVEGEYEVLEGKIKRGRAIRIVANGEKVEGVAHAMNANKNTITIMGTDHEAKDKVVQTTYEIAKGAEVIIDGKKAKFADLKPQMPIFLQMSALKEALVVGITAIGPKVEGVVKIMDAEKNTISVNIPKIRLATENVPVAKDAKVVIDGTEGKLSDLKAGMQVVLQMSAVLDESLVVGITAGKTEEKK